jgi:hypothetical protein
MSRYAAVTAPPRPERKLVHMFTTSRITRPVVLALAAASLAAGPAAAREADAPIIRDTPAATAQQPESQDLRAPDGADRVDARQQAAPPRTEGMGVQPVPAPSTPQRHPQPAATPLTTRVDSGGIDWLAVLVGACGVLALGLGAAAIRSHRSRMPVGTPHA